MGSARRTVKARYACTYVTYCPRSLTRPQTALQVYVRNYKQAPTGNIHGLLRKALRLDTILNTEESDSEVSQSLANPHCARCHTEFSPIFYPTPPSTPPGDGTPSSASQSWLCHRCKFQSELDGSVDVIRHRLALNGINGANGINGINGVVSS